jgi:tetratricopeptide repeat protein
MNTNYAAALMDAHRYPGALAQFQKALERDPKFGPAHHKLAYLYAPTGDFADAVSESQKFVFCAGIVESGRERLPRSGASRILQTGVDDMGGHGYGGHGPSATRPSTIWRGRFLVRD